MPDAFRKEWTIEIPVTTPDRSQFIRDTPGISDYEIASSVYSFIRENIPVHCTFRLPYLMIKEMVENSFDAHSLSMGSTIQLKVVVQIKKDQCIIKIKDNGRGFANKEKSKPFELDTMSYTDKRSGDSGCFGGARDGLSVALSLIQSRHGQMFFKNRKKEGASVYISAPLLEHSAP